MAQVGKGCVEMHQVGVTKLSYWAGLSVSDIVMYIDMYTLMGIAL